LIGIFNAALAAVDPYRAVLKSAQLRDGCLYVDDIRYDLAAFDRIIAVGAGKATARMAQAIETLLGERISAGLIVVKDGQTVPLAIIDRWKPHPVRTKRQTGADAF
jgi:hydroxypyruvate reductase